MDIIASSRHHGGLHQVIEHQSTVTQCPMHFGLFIPPTPPPHHCLYYLSGLTCTWENATTKAGAQAYAAKHNIVLVFPDTSPRGDDAADTEDYWLGQGAGFYLTATQKPWAPHFAMDKYITDELPEIVSEVAPISRGKAGITGHSMGGHGALTIAMKNPDLFASVSALAPITSPTASEWGRAALTAYLGNDPAAHDDHDSVKLIANRGWHSDILIDQGSDDEFLTEHLKPDLLVTAAEKASVPLTLNKRQGYDHSYYFVSSFIADHIAWHAKRLA